MLAFFPVPDIIGTGRFANRPIANGPMNEWMDGWVS